MHRILIFQKNCVGNQYTWYEISYIFLYFSMPIFRMSIKKNIKIEGFVTKMSYTLYVHMHIPIKSIELYSFIENIIFYEIHRIYN